MNKPKRVETKHFKVATVSSLVALCLGASSTTFATADNSVLVSGVLRAPTFTAEDVIAYNERKSQINDFYQGQMGVNRHIAASTEREVFTPEADITGEQTYIVQLSAAPIALYDGSIAGLAATKAPRHGNYISNVKVNTQSHEAIRYKKHLLEGQQGILSKASSLGANIKLKDQLTLARNAMVVSMTQADAEKLANVAGVTKITRSRVFQLNTDRSAEVIGADKAWQGELETTSNMLKGDRTVVGIIDTGVNTDHIAFSDVSEDGYEFPTVTEYLGDCAEDASLCNDKLIGVYSYDVITSVYNAPEFQADDWREWYPAEQIRPENGEDYNGHGSHTASTAAGNKITSTPYVAIPGEKTHDGIETGITFPMTSGVAPHAQIISYQVCWPGGSGDPYAGCPEEALLAAIEDAIDDGVDVINFSIGGAEAFPWDDPIELAFLSAREAGISVAAAAGNSGTFYSTDHTSPWLTSIGATTLDRQFEAGNKSMGNFQGGTSMPWSSDFQGKSFSGAITAPVVHAENYGDALCLEPFPAGTFNGEIVICDRGEIARVAKADNVASGGAGGFVLLNTSYSEEVMSDVFSIPGIHLSASDRYQLMRWINDGAPEDHIASITEAEHNYTIDAAGADILANFSSRGPSITNGDYLVPDVSAPGVEVYAAFADDQPFTNFPSAGDWAFLSGTSMASPQVAGAMLLIKQAHPEWSPAEVQSALMLTAKDTVKLDSFYDVNSWFHAGAGRINVDKAIDSGLIMDESAENYRDANPKQGGVVSWLNTASLTTVNCEQTCSWLRTVKATRDGTWTATGSGMFDDASLIDVTVEPAQFTLKAGESQNIMVTTTVPDYTSLNNAEGRFETRTDTNASYFFGQVQLEEEGKDTLNMPLTAAFQRSNMPKTIEVNAGSALDSYSVKGLNAPTTDDLTARSYPLVKPTNTTFKLKNGLGADLVNPDPEQGLAQFTLEVPEGSKRLVVEVQSYKSLNENERDSSPFILLGYDADGDGGTVDFPSYQSEIVCYSTHDILKNYCDITNPKAGKYWVMVHNYRPAPPVDYYDEVTVGYAIIGGEADNSLSVSVPTSVDGATTFDATLNWDLTNLDVKEGDVLYGGYDLGSTTGTAGDIGFSGIRMTRTADAISMSLSQESARVGDVIEVKLNVLANQDPDDRDFNISLDVPAGLTVLPDTLTSSTNAADSVSFADGTLTLAGNQVSTADEKRRYEVTSSLDTEQCKMPLLSDESTGGYEDLFSYGVQPQSWYEGDDSHNFKVPMDWLFAQEGLDVALYNHASPGYLNLSPTGMIQLDDYWWMYRWHTSMSYDMVSKALAAMWRGDFTAKYRPHYEDPWGLTLGLVRAEEAPELGNLLIMEFDNVTDKVTGDEFDYEIVLRGDIDFSPNMPEITMAYKNLGDVTMGSIGVRGYNSPLSKTDGPMEGYYYSDVAFNNLDEVIGEDVVLCYDYQGPESSQMEVSFQVRVDEQYASQDLTMILNGELGSQAALSSEHTISVNGNIKVGNINDMTVVEDGQIDNIKVFAQDQNAIANTIEVTGEGITATINDDSSFNLIPDADFFGKTEVTVIVRDSQVSSDIGMTKFMLTVTPTEDAPVAIVSAKSMTAVVGTAVTLDASNSHDMDGNTLTYSWSGPGSIVDNSAMTTEVTGLTEGSHTFTVEVSDGKSMASETVNVTVNAEVLPEKKSSSGGSFGWLSLIALGWLRLRRR